MSLARPRAGCGSHGRQAPQCHAIPLATQGFQRLPPSTTRHKGSSVCPPQLLASRDPRPRGDAALPSSDAQGPAGGGAAGGVAGLAQIPEIAEFEVGSAHLFIQAASLTINENASPDVPLDLADSLDRLVAEGPQYRHLEEGPDDMPAHVKSSLMGASLLLPIRQGRLALGNWQGIYLNEHRNYGGPRSVVVTLQGVRRQDGRRYSEHL